MLKWRLGPPQLYRGLLLVDRVRGVVWHRRQRRMQRDIRIGTLRTSRVANCNNLLRDYVEHRISPEQSLNSMSIYKPDLYRFVAISRRELEE